MKKQERADIVRRRLAELYPDPPIPLDHRDEFTLLVAVLLSAQCTDKKVNEITPALFRVAPTPERMRDLGEQKILDIIRPLGLSRQKAKSLATLSAMLIEQYDGEVPQSFADLEALPGVGHKTASVVMAQAFGVPAFPGLTLDLTYNTDFAQVEVDEQQVNLDRFNLFFPEKRPFFLENAGQFSVGSPGEVDLFFSRRIGIGEDGNLVPIIGGARLSGKVGQTNVGFLSMFTDDLNEAGIEKNNFTVARVNHDFSSSRSSLGGIFINRAGLGETPDDYNRVFAMDGKWGLGKKAQITGFVAKSTTPFIDENDHAYKLIANYDWDGWRINAGYTEVGEGFNPEVGFLQRSAFKKPEFLIFKTWRPKHMGKILELRPHVSYRSYWGFDDQLVTSFLHIDNHWVWKSGFEVHTGINFTTEGVQEAFDLSGVIIPVDTYDHSELQLVMNTNANKAVSLSTFSIIGGYFGGNRIANSGTLKIRLGDKFNSSLSLNHNYLDLPNGSLTAVLTSARLSYSFTPRMFVQSLVQHNNLSNIASVNARFGWLQSANTGLFVVLNIVKDDDDFDGLNNQSITIKYTYRFDLLKK